MKSENEEEKIPLMVHIDKYMAISPDDITAKSLLVKLIEMGVDTNIGNLRSVMSIGLRDDLFILAGKLGHGQHKEHLFKRSSKKYIFKDAAYYQRIKDNEANHDANRYIMSCMAR